MTECIICQIVDGSVPSKKVYEDEEVVAILDYNGSAPGHCFVIPKEHYPIMEQVPPNVIGKIFNVANKLSSAIFESLGVGGTNIFVTNGVAAGQQTAHFMAHVIPRKEGDGIQLDWQPRQLDEEEMSTVELRLKEEIGNMGVSTATTSTPAAEPAVKNIIPDDPDNYFSKQLKRIP